MILSIWVSAIFFQLGIVTVLVWKFRNHKNQTADISRKISIVVAARNEEDNLKRLLPALAKQDFEDYEIIVSLDRCTDQSQQYLEQIEESRLKIVPVKETPDGWDHKKYALTKAVAAASGEWLVFTDADCVPNSNSWLQSISKHFRPSIKIVLGYSPYDSNRSLLQTFIRFEAFVTAFHYLGTALGGKPYMGVGRNLAIEKEFFNDTGGYRDFKNTVGGDDDLFIQANATATNTAVMMGKDSIVTSAPAESFSDYWKQKMRHLKVGSSYSSHDKIMHILSGGSHLLVWLLLPFISNYLIYVIAFFYLTVKLIGYRFAASKMGSGFNYIYLPLVDVMYAIFLPIAALGSRLTKDTGWKN